jgi:hypothetical protein
MATINVGEPYEIYFEENGSNYYLTAALTGSAAKTELRIGTGPTDTTQEWTLNNNGQWLSSFGVYISGEANLSDNLVLCNSTEPTSTSWILNGDTTGASIEVANDGAPSGTFLSAKTPNPKLGDSKKWKFNKNTLGSKGR